MNDHVHDLGRGLPATLIRQAALARQDGTWEQAHHTAKLIAQHPADVHPDTASLFRGAPAVAYALHTADHRAYRPALARLDNEIATLVEARLAAAYRRMDTRQPPRMREYDLISGLTGLGAYLLHRATRPDLLVEILRYLVRLLQEPVIVDGHRLPGWWTSDSPAGKTEADWPLGHGNLGMAHGVAGPTALLALSTRAGHTAPGQSEALNDACDLLEAWARPLPAGGDAWPETLTLPTWTTGPPQQAQPNQPSWCYGAPGIARSLHLAALTCHRPHTQHRAERILTACATDPGQRAYLRDATVCHGWAGLCLTIAAAAADAPSSSLPHLLPSLSARLRFRHRTAPQPHGSRSPHRRRRHPPHAPHPPPHPPRCIRVGDLPPPPLKETRAVNAPTTAELRHQLVNDITAQTKLSPVVERALRTVRREEHLPGLDPADAYADKAVVIKENPGGPLALSCASVPSVVAMMLTQLDVRPGHRVLEIGAGTGYNAALLAELTGPDGQVTTIDIDSDVTVHARTALGRSGYPHVQVMQRDGLLGAPEHAPYDRLIATVGMWDIPAPWWQQLTDGGRLVLPLRWRGQTRSVALARHGDTLVSDGMELCGFVPVIGQNGERTTELADGTVRVHHDQDQQVTANDLTDVFSKPPVELWTDARVGTQEPFDGIWLRATAFDDTICRLEVTRQALDDGVRRPVIPARSPALVSGSSLAYLIAERDNLDPERPARLGAAGYGTEGPELARKLGARISAWSADRTSVPRLSVHPVTTPESDLPEGHIINKQDSRIALAYQ
ncbi:methyltransferase, FxLD system [Streptomyces sp. PmtG]